MSLSCWQERNRVMNEEKYSTIKETYVFTLSEIGDTLEEMVRLHPPDAEGFPVL